MKEIELLNKQVEKLNRKDFDLEAWKEYTIVIIGRIFGESSHKINLIRNIEYEHSSWSLRDTSGQSAIESCKKLGREILEASIAELENFGVPRSSENSGVKLVEIINEALQDELKGSQYKELKQIMNASIPAEEKRIVIAEKLISYDTESGILILSRILSNTEIVKH